jgi:SulP family sulfate permease
MATAGGTGFMQARLEPKLLTVLREGYTGRLFYRDLIAGIVVGIVALPLSIALAIASGVKPEAGLYTAVIAGFIISMLGGSRFQIGGPTGAFIVLVYKIVHDHGYDGLAVATLLAGALLICMGLARFGQVIKYIPYPVTVGFTSGIAVIIFTAQFRDLLGLQLDSVPPEFIEKVRLCLEHLPAWNPAAAALAAAALAVIYLWPRITRRVPGSLVAIVLGTLAVRYLDLPIETIGDRFGSMPRALPMPRLPSVNWATLPQLVAPALAIALLAGIESLLSAVVADGMTGRRHRSNMELIAQGAANLASPLFGGLPATGAIARTAANIKNGGQTPVAGMVHALTVLLILLVFGPLAARIPMPVLAAILVKVALDMFEGRLFLKLLRGPRGDILVLLSTFVLTVFVDLVVAIEAGVVLAAFLFMHRMAEVTTVEFTTDEVEEDDETYEAMAALLRDVPPGVEVFEINGPFFFGAADQFKDTVRRLAKPPRILILRMRRVPTMDATGLRALEDVFEKCQRDGTVLLLSGVHPRPRAYLQRFGLLDRIGPANVLDNFDMALVRARELLHAPPAP